MNRESGVVERREAGREAGPSGVVTIFVPPAVFEEVQPVFDPPMLTNMLQKISGSDLIGIQATHIIARIVQHDLAVVATDLAIDAQCDLAARQVERIADVVGVV